MKKLLSVLACTALVLGSLTGCGSSAKKYPEKTINVVVPYTAGGGTDLMVRTVGANIDLDGQNMIVTNIEGASGLTGTLECYHADPDGYTLVSMAAGLTMHQALIAIIALSLFFIGINMAGLRMDMAAQWIILLDIAIYWGILATLKVCESIYSNSYGKQTEP